MDVMWPWIKEDKWRHDPVLACIVTFLFSLLDDNQPVSVTYQDVYRGSYALLTTIPTTYILHTPSHHDIVLHCGSKVDLLEDIFCSNAFEGFGCKGREQSKQVYSELIGDLEVSGYNTTYMCTVQLKFDLWDIIPKLLKKP